MKPQKLGEGYVNFFNKNNIPLTPPLDSNIAKKEFQRNRLMIHAVYSQNFSKLSCVGVPKVHYSTLQSVSSPHNKNMGTLHLDFWNILTVNNMGR